jgi:hypothetical protein
VFNALDMSAQQFVSALLIEYVYRMGADPRFVSIASNVLPNDIRFFSKAEAEDLRVGWDPRKFEPWAIEPYRNGVIAYSRSRDKTLTATVFCRQDRIPHLLFTDKFSFEGFQRIQSAVAALEGIRVFGSRYPKGNVTARRTADAVGYEISLNGFRPQSLVGSRSVGIEGEIYRADEPFFYFQLSPENAAQTMGVALRNCL